MPIMETAFNDDVILSIGSVTSGSASNIIPDSAEILGNVRAFSREKREFLKRRIEEISSGIAAVWRGTAVTEYRVGVAPNVNDRELTKEMKGYIEAVAKKVEVTWMLSQCLLLYSMD